MSHFYSRIQSKLPKIQEFFELESLHESIDIVAINTQELDVFAETSFNIQLGSLVLERNLEAAFSVYLESGSAVCN